jgi:hypothetical protein
MLVVKDTVHVATQIIAHAANERRAQMTGRAILGVLIANPTISSLHAPKHPRTPLDTDRSPFNPLPSLPQHHHALSTLAAHVHSHHPSRDVHAVLMEPVRLLASSRLP